VSWADWNRGVEVEPSIYAANFASLGPQLESLLDAGARIFHFDVGDGHFVPEITIGPIVLESIAGLVHDRGGVLDCHLMVEEPARHFEAIKAAGGDSVTFHVEAEGDPTEVIAQARELGLGVGVAFNPETSVEHAVGAADGADIVLCMSIHPGLSGQELMPEALDRVAELRTLLPAGVAIQVDGGIHLETIAAARRAGADLLVSGSGVFWGDDLGSAYTELAKAADAELQTTTRQGAG
jgi:ribulose-phosphate 3-epimerase